ncbi:MAG: hypothetical protein ACI9Y7_000668, partial [Dokdonia sp.]
MTAKKENTLNKNSVKSMIQEISTIKNHPKTIPLHDIQGLIIRGYRVPIFRNF